MNTLLHWHKRGLIRTVDLALAQTALHLDSSTSETVLCALALCSRASADGHSVIPLSNLQNYLRQLQQTDLSDSDDAMLAQIAGMQHERFVQMGALHNPQALLHIEHSAIALRAYALAEQALADRIVQQSRIRFPLDDAIFAQAMDTLLVNNDESLVEICRASEEHGLLLLSGGPGTGKTHNIARVIAFHLLGGTLRIALAAPTGKAAARLNAAMQTFFQEWCSRHTAHADLAKKIPIAQTVHRLLGVRGVGRESKYSRERPLPYDVVIIDEASMLDLPRMRALFEALPNSSRVLLVGDPDQLPSVEAGQVMQSMCALSEKYPQLLKRIHLRTVHRQQSGSAIIELAEAIKQADADRAIALLASNKQNLHWHAVQNSTVMQSLMQQAQLRYAQMLESNDPTESLQAGNRFRVLCAERGGAYGTQAVNRLIAQRMGEDAERWFAGRWCLVEQNNYAQNLFNGDLGLCLLQQGELSVYFGGIDGVREFSPFVLQSLQAAFALTVHKAQGSEFDEAMLLLPDKSSFLPSREWLYTAVTRARRQLHIFASEENVRKAIEQRTTRWSSLAQRVNFN